MRTLSVEGSPLLIVKDAKSLGALVTTAMLPSNLIQKKRIEDTILSVKRLQRLPVELSTKANFIAAKVAPQACFGHPR